jgi:hypothetical protein
MVKKKQNDLQENSSSTIDRSAIGKRNKNRGKKYELKIIKELKELTGDNDLCSSRSESKKLDDMKIDIADTNNTLPCYIQCKATQATPNIHKICQEVGKTDKPLVIVWGKQEMRNSNQITVGEYCLMPKNFFYELIKHETSDSL